MSEEKLLEAIVDFANALEVACVQLKQHIGERVRVGVREETFYILKWEAQKGSKIGDFEVATKANNPEDKWAHAHNILKASNATISNRYHGPNYVYAYWLYQEDKIYRQILKK